MAVTFIYIFRKSNEAELLISVNLLRKNYPNSKVWVCGDKPLSVRFDKYIPFKASDNIRATRVTKMLIEISKHIDEYVLMYDDIFLNTDYDFSAQYHRGYIKPTISANGGYNMCLKNTLEYLSYMNMTTFNFECHNPILINSAKFLKSIENVNINHYHLPKSIYLNSIKCDNLIEIPDLKIKGNHPKSAKEYWNNYRAFSSHETTPIHFIKSIVQP